MPTPPCTISHATTDDMLDLQDTLAGFGFVWEDEDTGAWLAVGRNPETGRNTVLWCDPLPSVIHVSHGAQMAHALGGTQTSAS